MQDDIAVARATHQHGLDDDAMPIVETTMEVIQYYNRGERMKGFEKTGYFIVSDVIVCEQGKADVVREALAKEIDNLVVVVAPEAGAKKKK